MHSGELFNRIAIQVATKTQSPSGETTQTWADGPVTLWANIKPVHARDIEIAMGRTKGKSCSHQISTRWNSNVAPTTNRIRFGTRIFEIFSVLNVEEAGEELSILADEIVS